jgi:arsenate reductase
MKKAFYLSTCSTCVRILKEINTKFDLQDIKTNPVTAAQLDEMYAHTSSYEALFSKRAQKYKSRGLKDQNLQEADFKKLLLEEYTFLKRPVFLIDNTIFVGNSKKIVESLKAYLADE